MKYEIYVSLTALAVARDIKLHEVEQVVDRLIIVSFLLPRSEATVDRHLSLSVYIL